MSEHLLEKILDELAIIKKGLPNGELKMLTEDVKHLKEEFAEVKGVLLDPEDGLVVRTNRNTEFRLREEATTKEYYEYAMDLQSIKKWKNNVTTALWIIFTTLAGVIFAIVAEALKKS